MHPLNQHYTKHKSLEFPTHSDDDVFDDYLLSLAEYDAYLAGVVETILCGQKPDGNISGDDGLFQKILSYSPSPDEITNFERARRYVQSLNEMRLLIRSYLD